MKGFMEACLESKEQLEQQNVQEGTNLYGVFICML